MTSVPMESPSVSVVIPVYNEADRILPTLAAVASYFSDRDAEILVVDDGSSDETVAISRAFAANHPEITVIEESHRGKAATVLSGMSAAHGDIIGFMDADLATPLETWEACEVAIASGAGVAIASREGIGADRIGEPLYRHIMGRVFNSIVRLLLLPGIHDTQCGFKFFSRQALHDILPRERLYRNAAVVANARVTAFDVELLYIARLHGHEIAVIPITWQYGVHSKVNPITDTFQNFRDVLKVKLNGLRGRYR